MRSDRSLHRSQAITNAVKPLALLVLLLVPLSAARADDIWAVVNQVSVDSYTNYLDDFATGPRYTNAQRAAAQAQLYGLFASMGLDTSINGGTYSGWGYNNVVGVHQGTTRADEIYIVSGHYDTISSSPGADDDGSGIAGVLEAARVLSQYESEATIIFIAFDREELGLIGSAAYAQQHQFDNIQGMISLDMIAYNPGGANTAYVYGRSESDPLKYGLEYYLENYAGLGVDVGGDMPYSDHAPFEGYGFDAGVLIEHSWDTNPYYHTANDSVFTPNYLDYAFGSAMTRGTVAYLAGEAGVRTPEPGTLALMGCGILLVRRLRRRSTPLPSR